MPFEADDIYVGMIAYFAVCDLQRHPLIRRSRGSSPDPKPRPFVCYAQAADRADLPPSPPRAAAA